MKEALTIVLILLLVSVGLNVQQWRSAKEENLKRLLDNGRAQVEIAAKTAEIQSRDTLIRDIRAKVGKDSLAYLRSTEGLKQANSRLARKIQELRPLIATDLAENDTLQAFVMAQDSLLAGKDSLLRDTELFCQLQVRDLSKIIELQEQKYEAQKQITAAVTEQLADETREHRKTKRKGKFKSVVIGALVAAVVYLAVKP